MTKCNFTKKKKKKKFGRGDACECWLSIAGVDDSFYSFEFDGKLNLIIFSINVIERLVPAAAEQITIVSIKAING